MSQVVRDRSCGSCTLCCKLLRVEELDTPPGHWCPHCDARAGCSIYTERPTECRQFFCEYLLDGMLGEHWRPARCKMVVVYEEHLDAIVIHVDPDRPHAWRAEPYRSDIRRWARKAAGTRRQVIVWQGNRKIVIAPDAPTGLYDSSLPGP